MVTNPGLLIVGVLGVLALASTARADTGRPAAQGPASQAPVAPGVSVGRTSLADATPASLLRRADQLLAPWPPPSRERPSPPLPSGSSSSGRADRDPGQDLRDVGLEMLERSVDWGLDLLGELLEDGEVSGTDWLPDSGHGGIGDALREVF